ncbi:capsule assembly protein Wzi [Dyadobacter jejuensis]|uniref:Capsule assembly protein Wzi n=1 Tax=Dyadobacter jejuensis TaxID=1082580 RepID=A0A316ASC9_9BACT|nr:capsule assembly Wzi family protein [Dyadobacter jejuensis]PWJ60331.1 capsule assembly protein Wzi [Dyadobacter jejuensis]
MLIKLLLFCLLLIGIDVCAQAQTSATQWQSSLQMDIYANERTHAPFWFTTNRYGTTPEGSVASSVRLRWSRPYQKIDSSQKWDYTIALQPVLNRSLGNFGLLLPEANAGISYGPWELHVGRSQAQVGLSDSTLSSGNFIQSANALPRPRVLLSSRNFVPLRPWNQLFSINMGFGVGINNDDYIKKSYWHQKYLYLQIGQSKHPFKVFLGTHHQVIWGGEAEYLKSRPDIALDGKLPSSLRYWNNILLGTKPKASANLTAFDQDYRIGNHMGTYELALQWNSPKGMVLFYHQHPFEDVSGAALQNIPDGLYGLSWKPQRSPYRFPAIRKLAFEYLHTLSQSGSTFLRNHSIFQGNDNYFNHSQYAQGWTYRQRSLGSPFLLPRTEVTEEVSRSHPYYFPNTRIQVWYLAVKADLMADLHMACRISYSRNRGTNDSPITPAIPQTSVLLTSEWLFNKRYLTQLKLAWSLDRGRLLDRNSGLRVSLLQPF